MVTLYLNSDSKILITARVHDKWKEGRKEGSHQSRQSQKWTMSKLIWRFLNVLFNYCESSNRWLFLGKLICQCQYFQEIRYLTVSAFFFLLYDTWGLSVGMMMMILIVLYVEVTIVPGHHKCSSSSVEGYFDWTHKITGSKHCTITDQIKALTGASLALKPDSKLQYFRIKGPVTPSHWKTELKKKNFSDQI